MQAKRFPVILLLLTLGGCGSTTKIIDYDPENGQLPPGVEEYEPTEPHVELATVDGITIIADQAEPFMDIDQWGNKVERGIWQISARNESEYYSHCVTIAWRLLDFKLHMEGPSEFLILPKETRNVGMMVGQTMELDGVQVAPPPSGYIRKMRLRPPVGGAKEGEECLHLPKKIKER